VFRSSHGRRCGNQAFESQGYFRVGDAGFTAESPGGKRIVYVRQFAGVMEDKRRSKPWIVNFDGSGHRPLTTGKYSDSAPQWPADGSELIFISGRDGAPQIYLLWVSTGQIAKLTSLTQPRGGAALVTGREVDFVHDERAR
jgi:hypothetical protein